jgi:hypothetical protein
MNKWNGYAIPTNIMDIVIDYGEGCSASTSISSATKGCWGVDCTGHNCILHYSNKEACKQYLKEQQMKMPELKAGQVVVVDWEEVKGVKYLYIGDNKTIDLNNFGDASQPLVPRFNEAEVVAIYDVRCNYSINRIKNYNNLTLVWSKKDTQEQIAKLETTIAEASKQLQELKETL